MKKVLVGSLLLVSAMMASPAFADDDNHSCSKDMASWQSEDALKEKLVGQGWEVRQIKKEDGCYEVYGITDKGDRVEAYFDPATLMPVSTKSKD
ncbi:MAG: PepSY domain-containing protein [Alphaproteobacteria bacterium]|nr:PepSY domain-containing protein [Alphaproteobacteria bacterium]